MTDDGESSMSTLGLITQSAQQQPGKPQFLHQQQMPLPAPQQQPQSSALTHQQNVIRRGIPAANSYKTSIFHKNQYVEDLLSILEPTPEQAARQAIKQAEIEAHEKAKIEYRRKERNRKTKVALTQKQKVHAEKLFQSLGGSVSRKELEKTAFNAA